MQCKDIGTRSNSLNGTRVRVAQFYTSADDCNLRVRSRCFTARPKKTSGSSSAGSNENLVTSSPEGRYFF